MLDKNVRCDGCGAEAWVTLEIPLIDSDAWVGFGEPDGPRKQTPPRLDFCSHHYNKHSILLHAQGWEITHDERERINVKPSISANAE